MRRQGGIGRRLIDHSRDRVLAGLTRAQRNQLIS